MVRGSPGRFEGRCGQAHVGGKTVEIPRIALDAARQFSRRTPFNFLQLRHELKPEISGADFFFRWLRPVPVPNEGGVGQRASELDCDAERSCLEIFQLPTVARWKQQFRADV